MRALWRHIIGMLTSDKKRRNRWHLDYALFSSRHEKLLQRIAVILGSAAALSSVLCLVMLSIYVGYELKASTDQRMMLGFRLIQLIFGLNILYRFIFFYRETLHNNRIIKWVVDVALLVSLLVCILPESDTGGSMTWYKFISGNKFLLLVLGAYSVVDMCYALSYIPGRRTNPSLMMAISFLVFILIGSLMLMLPRCTYDGITYVDSLFVASSAVSITGLSSVNIDSTFTPFGILVLSVLIQLGSLGLITFTSFFALFFAGNTSIYNQLLLRDVIYSKSMNALIPTLLYVLGFTLSVELLGAVSVFFTIPESLGFDLEQKVIFSAFHSMSSFCNAGFSCVKDGMSNPAFMHSDQNIYIVTSLLIFAGGVGFPILVNFKEIIRTYINKLLSRIGLRKRGTLPIHIFDINTKIVLYTTLTILIVSTAAFFVLEYNNTLEGMTLKERVVQSVFNSLIPRSAGFASVNPAHFLDITIVLILIQMFIGGSSQSMAGGIKVNTLGTVILSLKSVVLGHKGVCAFKRSINLASVRRANAVVIVAIFTYSIYLIAVMILEPSMSTKSLVFEVASALFTVGSSLGITAELSDGSKILLSTAMFLGRVGVLSLMTGMIGLTRDASDNYPIDNVIIN